MNSQLKAHLLGPGKKRILALDGGGVRGVISLCFLERLEAQLAAKSDNPDGFRLCDHFALIGGTSTGAIIATGLALGYRVGELLEIYTSLSKEAFGKKYWFSNVFLAPKFSSAPLMEIIGERVQGATLGSDLLRCGLGIVAKRLDSSSVWLFHNHPRGPFYEAPEGDVSFAANKDLPLLSLIKASAAAPTYFDPEPIDVAPGVSGEFVDGGVSPHNNPALALLMLATLSGYGFRWPTGLEALEITSVGTGLVKPMADFDITARANTVRVALASMHSLMHDNQMLVQTLMQWMGRTARAWPINAEIGALDADQLGPAPLFDYARYDLALDRAWLKQELGEEIREDQLRHLRKLDRPDTIDTLIQLGRAAAARQISDPS